MGRAQKCSSLLLPLVSIANCLGQVPLEKGTKTSTWLSPGSIREINASVNKLGLFFILLHNSPERMPEFSRGSCASSAMQSLTSAEVKPLTSGMSHCGNAAYLNVIAQSPRRAVRYVLHLSARGAGLRTSPFFPSGACIKHSGRFSGSCKSREVGGGRRKADWS